MNQNNPFTLYYVHDPMCSWCWAFVPTWQNIKQKLEGKLPVRYLLGGLAPDSAEVMPKAMQDAISGYWHTIEVRVPGTKFNHDFWTKCQPRRSTYPSCRAVIAARVQKPETETAMILAIQEAYYLQAKNPSDDETLIALAGELGLDEAQFAKDLNSAETQRVFEQEMQLGGAMGAQGFPSLILQSPEGYRYLPLDYNRPEVVLDQLKQLNAI
jgi:putative protein-disulfide isomerase